MRTDLLAETGEREPSARGELAWHALDDRRPRRCRAPPGPTPSPAADFLEGLIAFRWDALDEWFAEAEQLFGHPKDPYSRIDVCRTTRHVRVLLDGEVLADSRRARVLYEAALPPRWYLPAEDVDTDRLVPSGHLTRCAYKGARLLLARPRRRRARRGPRLELPGPGARRASRCATCTASSPRRSTSSSTGWSEERPETQWSPRATRPAPRRCAGSWAARTPSALERQLRLGGEVREPPAAPAPRASGG